jgi:hypothetical protein
VRQGSVHGVKRELPNEFSSHLIEKKACAVPTKEGRTLRGREGGFQRRYRAIPPLEHGMILLSHDTSQMQLTLVDTL